MLMTEPGIRIRGLYRKISACSQPPDNIAGAGSVLIVDFNYPVLVAHGKQQVVIGGRVGKRIAVQPVDRGTIQSRTVRSIIHFAVFSQYRSARGVEIVER